MRRLNRSDWNALHDEIVGTDEATDDTRVTITSAGIDIERFGGRSSVSLFGSERATDLRIGHVQVLASRDRLVLISHSGKFPVTEWAVLYDGPVCPEGSA